MAHNTDRMFLRCLIHLNASPLAPCVREMIYSMRNEDLHQYINTLMALLQNKECDLHQQKLIYDFLCEVLPYRKDGEYVVTEQLVPIAVKDLLEADTKGHDQVTAAVSRVLYTLAKVYGDIVIYEILHSSDMDPIPASVLKTLSAIKTYLDMKGHSENKEVLYRIKPKVKVAGGSDILKTFKKMDNHEELLKQPRKHRELVRYVAIEAVTAGTWKMLYRMIKTLLRSSVLYNKRTATFFLAEILSMTIHLPKTLQMDDYKALKEIVLRLLEEDDFYTAAVALQCLETLQHPEEAKKYKFEITENLMKKISPRNRLTGKLMKALLAVMQMNKWEATKKNRRLLKELFATVSPYIWSGHEETQIYSIKLFGAVGEKLGKAKIVNQHLPALLIKVHSYDRVISSSAETSTRQCLPDLRREAVPATHEERLQQLYDNLQKHNLLKPALFYCLLHLAVISDTDALAKHIILLTDTIPQSDMAPSDLALCFRLLAKNARSMNPPIRSRVAITCQILGEKWECIRMVLKIGVLSNFIGSCQ